MRLLLLLSSLFPILIQAQPLNLSAPNQRFSIQLNPATSSVEICNLRLHEQYRLRLVPPDDFDCSVSFIAPAINDDDQMVLEFTATESCMSFPIGHNCTLQDIALTANCTSCPKRDQQPDQRMNNIQTIANANATFLIEDVFIGGGCFDVSGATASGRPGQIGTFSSGGASINLEDGIILSSGNISLASGPNNAPNITQGYGNASSDPDLATLAGGPFFDRAAIEFSFQPTVSVVTFQYAFASDEYCEYVNTQFNDVFGFFISGPGINGPFSNNAINIAQVPGSGDFVSINTVNHLQNTPFYNDNAITESCAGGSPVASAFLEYDGFTTVLTAVANVIPCETYHIKLVVADRGDDIYDSAVFLKANSFNGGALASSDVAISGLGVADNAPYEGCGDGFFVFTREDLDLSEPFTINFNVSPLSTATPGLDYAPFPSSVTIPAGQTSVTVFVDIFADLIAEGTESIIIELSTPCSCSSNTVELLITDPPPLSIIPEPPIFLCEDGSTTLSPDIFGGLPNYSYQWDNGTIGPTLQVSPDQQSVYFVTVTDQCGQVTVGQFDVIPFTPTATLSGSGAICEQGSFNANLMVEFTGPAPYTLTYTVDGFTETITDIYNSPFQLPASIPGTYELVAVSALGCPGDVSGQGVIDVTAITLNTNVTDNSCFATTDGSIVVEPTGGNAPYDFNWSGLPAFANVIGMPTNQTITNLPAGTYNLTVTDINNCSQTTTVLIEEPEELIAAVDDIENVDCSNLGEGAITVFVSGGSGDLSFLWNTGAVTQNLSNLSPGQYDLQITDGLGCTAQVSAVVLNNIEYPEAAVAPPDILNCTLVQQQLDASGSSSNGPFSYSWNTANGNIVGSSTLQNITVDAAGDYALIVTNTNNQCADTVSITVEQDVVEPIADAGPDSLLNCTTTALLLDGGASDQGDNYSYLWSTSNGTISGDADTLVVETDSPGTYILSVQNLINGCITSDTVVIDQDIAEPIINITPPQTVDCNNPQITLDASGSVSGDLFAINWSTVAGNILTPTDSLQIQIDQGGEYTLEITNTQNGCTSSATVEIELDQETPVADAGLPQELDCETASATLNGNGSSSNGNFAYSWTTTNGTIQSGGTTLSPVVSNAGTYNLLVTNIDNGCTATSSVLVSENSNAPIVSLAAGDDLNCEITSLTISGSGSDSGPDFALAWTDEQGNILNSTDLMLEVSDPGQYTLSITNLTNSCISTASINIFQDITMPVANAGPGITLTCDQPSYQLDGTGSDQGSSFAYNWSTTDGQIPEDGTILTPTIDQAGTYTLTVLNTENGCQSTDAVQIEVDQIAPEILLSSGGELNCAMPVFSLSATVTDAGTAPTYDWTTLNGTTELSDGILEHQIDEAGSFELFVTNTENGCSSSQSVSFTENFETPIASAGAPITLTCDLPQATLDASVSGQQGALQYSWTTSDGNITNGAAALQPSVDAPGTYQLIVTNLASQCSDTTSVVVSQNIEAPIIDAGSPQTLNCYQPSLTLTGSAQTSTNNLNYLWTTTDGTIDLGNTTLSPSVSAAGTYQLQVINQDNGCVSQDEVLIDQDQEIPLADAGSDGLINCASPIFSLSGNASQGSAFDISWNTLSGNVTLPAPVLQHELSEAGTFELVVFNTQNGCENRDTVAIDANFETPVADIGPGGLLTCSSTAITLGGGNTSGGSNISYQWQQDGADIPGATQQQLSVSDPGMYELIVTNDISYCTVSSTIIIDQDIATPQVEAGPGATLTCTQPSLVLDGNASVANGDYSLTWSTMDGVFDQYEDSLNPVISTPGTYTLQITDLANGCSSSDAVTILIDQNIPQAATGDDLELNCAAPGLTINTSGTTEGPIFTQQWNVLQGNASTDLSSNILNPTIDEPGIFELVVINTDNGCIDRDTVFVEANFDMPIADAGDPTTLTCSTTSATLSGGASSASPDLSFSWQSQDGNFTGTSDMAIVQVDAPGLYTLVVTDNASQCTDTVSITIPQDIESPTVDAGFPFTLTCSSPQTILNGSASANSNNLEVLWTSTDGNIISGANTFNPIIDQAGTYQLEVQNLENGCSQSAVVEITIDQEAPEISAGADFTLNCATPEITTSASIISAEPSYSLNWTDLTGTSIGTVLNPDISQAGTYILSITNAINGCSDADTLVVSENFAQPTALIANPDILTCTQTEILLDGSASSSNGQYSYQWTSMEGNPISNADAIDAMITEPGTYQLLVTDLTSFCTDLTTIEVLQDINLPQVNAGTPAILNCADPTTTIGDGTLPDGGFSYQWDGPSGGILSDPTQTTAQIGQPGLYSLTATNIFNGCQSIDQILITIDTLAPIAAAGAPATITCAVPSLSLDGSNSDTGPAFTYNWTDDNDNLLSNNLSFSIDEPGMYTLTVINNNNGCQSIDAVEITIDTIAPVAIANVDDILTCTTTQLPLSAEGSSSGTEFSYQWTTNNGSTILNSTSMMPLISAAGQYDLLVQNLINGCSTTTATVVDIDTIAPVLNIDEPATLSCFIPEQSLVASAEGDGPMQFSWSTGNGAFVSDQNTASPTINGAGTYQLDVIDSSNGCTSLASVVVSIDTLSPGAGISTIQELTCDNQSIILQGSTSTSNAVSYFWNSPDGHPVWQEDTDSPSVSAPGPYQLAVTDLVNGCISIATFVVTQDELPPVISIVTPDILTCVTSSVILQSETDQGTIPYTYTWRDAFGNIIGLDNPLSIEVDNPGLFTLTVENTYNGCISTTEVEVEQDINIPVADAGNPIVLNCMDTALPLDGSGSSAGGSFAYQWTSSNGSILSGAQSRAPVVNAPGLYSLLVTNTFNGCTNTDAVTASYNVPTDLEVSNTQPPCFGDRGSITIDHVSGGFEPYLYSIDGGENFSNNPVFTNVPPGDYGVLVQDVNGCEVGLPMIIYQPEQIRIDLEAQAEIKFGDTYQLNAMVNYPEEELQLIQWTGPDSLSCRDCLDPLAMPTRTSTYEIQVVNENGCRDVASIQIFVDRRPAIFIPNAFSPNGDGNNERFTIYAKEGVVSKINSLQIFNRWGEMVYEVYDFPPNDETYGWNGLHRSQEMNAAVFVYWTEIELIDGTTVLYKGDVNLMR